MRDNLVSPRVIRELLEKYNFEFSKSLGQNFLVDRNIIDNIIEKADINSNTNVLEIGPGMGTLTRELAKHAKKVVAVEIDESLKPVLDYTLGDLENVELIFSDILKLDLEKLSQERFNGEKIKVVANLPYYITTPILIHLLKSGINIDEMIVMMQKEVAQRLIATKDKGEYGSITVFMNYFGKGEILLGVPKTVFMPKPNVDSAVYRIKIENKVDIDELEGLERVLRAAFQMRRKTIVNSLSSGLKIDKNIIGDILDQLKISAKSRAENLSLEDYLRISQEIKKMER